MARTKRIGLLAVFSTAMPAFFRRIKQSLSTLADTQDRIQTLKSGSSNLPLSRQPSQGVDLHITTPSLHIETGDYEVLEEQKNEEPMV
ncbi:MAG: hypothetical protein LQ337_004713 [Flavoplaca oasis]|nr:MAG: hypothetical protein LQ337_004713 [Flavoplaca oasis]